MGRLKSPAARPRLRGKVNRFKQLIPVRQEIISRRAFLRLATGEPDAIRESHLLPPKLGDGTFGAVSVTYRKPRRPVGRPIRWAKRAKSAPKSR